MKLIAKAIVVSGLPIQKNVRYFNKFYTSEIKQKFKDLQKSVCPSLYLSLSNAILSIRA